MKSAALLRAWSEGLSGDALHTKIDNVFCQLDLDAGGTLDKKEVKKACALLGRELSDEEVEALFR